MNMKKIFASLAFLMAATTSPLAHAADPSPVPDLVKTWAEALNKPVVWEAGDDYRSRLVHSDDIDMSKPGALDRALAGLNAVLEKAGHVPLKVCDFDNALVVRRVTQPACDKPI
jgi:hypothetical protein